MLVGLYFDNNKNNLHKFWLQKGMSYLRAVESFLTGRACRILNDDQQDMTEETDYFCVRSISLSTLYSIKAT